MGFHRYLRMRDSPDEVGIPMSFRNMIVKIGRTPKPKGRPAQPDDLPASPEKKKPR
jgi:hypothetical protein